MGTTTVESSTSTTAETCTETIPCVTAAVRAVGISATVAYRGNSRVHRRSILAPHSSRVHRSRDRSPNHRVRRSRVPNSCGTTARLQ